jgi:uncharacterized protein
MHRLLFALAYTAAALVGTSTAQADPPVTVDYGVTAHTFDISQVTLNDGRWYENQERTLTYIKFVDLDRLLYVFRNNHGLPTDGAMANGGWDAPDFPFRSHFQGHILTAWTQCYASLKDTECLNRATSFVAELLNCQNNNVAAGFNTGYLSGFPESEFDLLENGTLSDGNVPYYAVHKTMSGLLDAWRILGNANAETALLALANWVDTRTSKLSTSQMQSVLATEFGGMNDVLADIYRQTGDSRWITVAERFDHTAVFDPLAADEDQLNGLHANTQVPKWIGATREYKATGSSRYLDIARNAWEITVNHHSYSLGGNSQAEHFHASDEIAEWLDTNTCEHCNSYNMLKLSRELWTLEQDPAYLDLYERALVNHLLGAQNPSDPHGGVTYFTSLNPGGFRGLGPAWGGGTWSTDYESFWCCQGTGVEQNTRLMDAIYGYGADNNSLYVNLFAPSTLSWTQKGLTVTQVTDMPVSDTSTLTITGGSSEAFALHVRIPSWVASDATIAVNGAVQDANTTAGVYATVERTWASGDTVTITLPLGLRLVPANDDAALAAVAYGPAILSGNYGQTNLTAAPTLDLSSITRTSSSSLDFTGTADGSSVSLGPFYDAQGFNYVVYWAYSGSLSTI